MTQRSVQGWACVLGLIVLLGAYRVAAAHYVPRQPIVTRLANRQTALASFMLDARRMDLAVQVAQQATVTDPDSAESHFVMAAIYTQNQRSAEAIAEYREAIRCNPELSDARIGLGVLLAESGRLEEAAEQFRAAGDSPAIRRALETIERSMESRDQQRAP